MEVRQLQIFRTLAEELNFTRTAEKVNTVQSNVTAQIKALEEELGTPLFDRLGRRVSLTDAGRNFLPFALQALAAMDHGQRALKTGAEPSGPHPRMLLDADLRAAWKAQAKLPHGPVVGAIALCEDARNTREHDHAVYQGSEWAKVLQACLVAWAATDDHDDQTTAIRFFTALIDDLDEIGDHKGGDEAARRDDGYAIRNLGPYTALAYDWLYDKLTP